MRNYYSEAKAHFYLGGNAVFDAAMFGRNGENLRVWSLHAALVVDPAQDRKLTVQYRKRNGL